MDSYFESLKAHTTPLYHGLTQVLEIMKSNEGLKGATIEKRIFVVVAAVMGVLGSIVSYVLKDVFWSTEDHLRTLVIIACFLAGGFLGVAIGKKN